MALNPADYLADLDPAAPLASDPVAQADDHLRAIKKAIKQTFPEGFDAELSVTQTQLNGFGGRIDALEAVPLSLGTDLAFLVSGGGAFIDASGDTLLVKSPSVTPAIGSLTINSVGNHAVTGVGFSPAAVMCFAFGSGADVGSQTQVSIGISGAGTLTSGHAGSGSMGYEGFAMGNTEQDAYLVAQGGANSLVVYNRGTVASLDRDGFTLNESIGERTANIMWVAFRK